MKSCGYEFTYFIILIFVTRSWIILLLTRIQNKTISTYYTFGKNKYFYRTYVWKDFSIYIFNQFIKLYFKIQLVINNNTKILYRVNIYLFIYFQRLDTLKLHYLQVLFIFQYKLFEQNCNYTTKLPKVMKRSSYSIF